MTSVPPVSQSIHQYSTFYPKILKKGTTPHVGIIGAGLAGLRCADILLQKGVRVTILEARDRIGGRICQGDIGGHSVDLGPNWIHGTESNAIVGISRRSNTVTHSWDSPQDVLDSAGQQLDAELTARLTEFLWTTIDKAMAYSQSHKSTIPVNLSLLDYLNEELEKTSFLQSEKELCVELSKLWGAYIGSPVDKQSLKFFFLEECLEGTNLFVASTYRNIVHTVAEPALRGAEIILNEPVVHVEAQPRKEGIDHSVKVTVDSGKEYTFDEVVATFPLGWLKKNKDAFSPSFPERLSLAIDNISYGHLEKIYVNFSTAFWHATNPQAGGNAESKSEDTVPLTGSTQFLNPDYVDHPATPFWNQECFSLAALPKDQAHSTLLFYLYGPCGSQIVSQIASMSPTSKEYYKALDAFLHPFYSRLPGYDSTSPSCKPIAFLATKWQTDPWAGNGSYSNFQVGLEEGDRDIEVMREGLGPDRGVWFAGEHTAPFVALGTTVGAYWSGELVAEKVYEVLKGAED